MTAEHANTALFHLCRVADIPDGQSKGFDPHGTGRDTMFIVRQGDMLRGYLNSCPHYDRARMAWKKNEFLNGDGSHIMCAAHAALFRIDDGECVIGPCLGLRLTPLRLVVRHGEVFLDETPRQA